MSNRLLSVKDVEQILNRKSSYCYKVMRELNNELKEKGFYINEGRIPAKYFYKRIGLDYEEEEAQ